MISYLDLEKQTEKTQDIQGPILPPAAAPVQAFFLSPCRKAAFRPPTPQNITHPADAQEEPASEKLP